MAQLGLDLEEYPIAKDVPLVSDLASECFGQDI